MSWNEVSIVAQREEIVGEQARKQARGRVDYTLRFQEIFETVSALPASLLRRAFRGEL
jgi:hypothetical protein